MNALNAVLARLVALLLSPFVSLPGWVGLCVFGVLSGVAAAIAFRFTSSQSALRAVADQTRASLLAMRLFSDDPMNTLRAQFSLLRASGKRLLLSLPPMAVMIVPFALLLAHLAMWYEFRPLSPREAGADETALLEARFLDSAWAQGRDLTPILPDGVAVDARLRDERDHSVTWRLSIRRPTGLAKVRFALPGAPEAEKTIVAEPGRSLAFACPVRPGPSFWDRVLYPGEPAFDKSSPIQSIHVSYPRRSTPVFGFDAPWWLTFFVASILGALATKPFLRVQF